MKRIRPDIAPGLRLSALPDLGLGEKPPQVCFEFALSDLQ